MSLDVTRTTRKSRGSLLAALLVCLGAAVGPAAATTMSLN